MIYIWCVECGGRKCFQENSHRASRAIKYRADFMLGGRYGKRMRQLFSTKKDAEAFEYVTLADFKRGTFLPKDTSKTLTNAFVDEYIEKRVKVYMKGCIPEEYRLKAFRDRFEVRPLNSLSLADWEKYVKERLEKGISKTTINRELTGIKTMFKWGVDNGYLKINPFNKAKKFKEEVIKVRWLNDAEIQSVLAECTKLGDLDLRDIIVVALNTGFRKANLMQVTANDIIGNRIEAKKTKSGKAYQVPINRELANTLNRLVSRHSTGPLLNFYGVKRRFRKVVKDSTISLHTFRHTFAAQCLKRGIPIDRVCAWMGHHSMEFTRAHYGHLCPSQENIEIELLNLGSSKNYAPSVSSIRLGDQGTAEL